jgi:hypothetical protein
MSGPGGPETNAKSPNAPALHGRTEVEIAYDSSRDNAWTQSVPKHRRHLMRGGSISGFPGRSPRPSGVWACAGSHNPAVPEPWSDG